MIKILDRSTEKIIGFHISEKVTEEEIKIVNDFFQNSINKNGKINWLGLITDYKGMACKAFFRDFWFNMKNMKNFNKKAVVTDIFTFKMLTKIIGPLLKIKYYKTSNLEDAWKYIEEE
jgi:hypothetical protein